jgi:hypothetical protein
MIGGTLAFGLFLAIFVKPALLGIMVVAGSAGMAALNFTKKKKSLIQLYQTPHGLKLYQRGVLIEEASTPTFKLSDVREVNLVRHGAKDILLIKGWDDNPITGVPYMKLPYRMIRSEVFFQIVKDWYKSSYVRFSKDLNRDIKLTIDTEEKKNAGK